MKTIYSILYVPLNTALDEKISIGMIMTNGKEHYFRYSVDKLHAIKGIINSDKIHIVKSYLKSLEKEVNFVDDNTLFYEELNNNSKWINEKYLSYLSKYSNNVIQFSSPKFIDLDFDENQNLLVKRIIDRENEDLKKVKIGAKVTQINDFEAKDLLKPENLKQLKETKESKDFIIEQGDQSMRISI